MTGYYISYGGGSYDDSWHGIKDNKIYLNKEKADQVCQAYNDSIKPENLKAQMVMPFELMDKYFHVCYDSDELTKLFEEAGVNYGSKDCYSDEKSNTRIHIRAKYEEAAQDKIMEEFMKDHPEYNDEMHDNDYKIYSKIKYDNLWEAEVTEIEIVE